jgi:hypothetical protein
MKISPISQKGGNLNELWLIFSFYYFFVIKSPYAEVPCSEASNPAISSSGVTRNPTMLSIAFKTPYEVKNAQAPIAAIPIS